MKKKFTFLIAAALMLLTMMASTGTMLGQNRASTTVSYGWEDNDDATKWTITDAITKTADQGNTGSYAGKINTNHTYVQFNEKVNVTSFSFAFKRTSNNNNYNVYIETSTDGSTWTAVETYAMSSFSNGSYTTKSHTFDGTTQYYVRFHCYNTTAVRYVDDVSITYNTGDTPTCATPTFTPIAGTYTQAQSVTISCVTEGATIHYTIDGTDPTINSSTYSSAINVSETTTIKAFAIADGYDNSSVASATYNIVNIEHAGTAEDPYTVADARTAIDANYGVTGVYATGIVSEIVTAYGTGGYNNMTFNMVDEAGDEVFLQAYRCVGDDAPNVLVGDIAVVTGNLTKYGQTYEFASGCSVVSLEHPSTPYITADDVEITYDTDADEIEYTINNPVDGGVLTAATESDWLTLGEVEDASVPFTCPVNEIAAARTSTVTLTYTYGDNQTVTKDVTVTQAGNPNIFDNITDITGAGDYHVKGMVVATSARGFIIGDGTGYVYTYMGSTTFNYGVGDNISISGTTSTNYGNVIQFTNAATIETVSETNYNGDPQPEVITEVPDYSAGNHLSTYFQYEGLLTKTTSGNNTYYNIAVGEGTIRISYPTTDQITELENLLTKTVRVHGFFAGNSSTTFTTMMESIEEVVVTTPSITVSPATVNAPFVGADGSLTITYENIPDLIAFDILFCDANGDELQGDDPDWIDTEIQEENNVYSVYYVIGANNGEARNAYFKVYTFVGANLDPVYSNLITVNQAEYVAPSYAELPFAFNGGKADIENTDGLTQEGLGSDYNATSNPTTKLKFDGTGDWLLLQFDERPGTLTFNIKGNSFSGSTFKVQTSEDGITYTDLETYTELGDTQDESFDNLDENVRYIKWIYTEKSSGNVGLGNIALAAYAEPTASITVDPATVNVTADGEDEGSLAIAYEQLTITDPADFDIQYYNANNEPLGKDDEPDWMAAAIQYTATQQGFEVSYSVDPNDGDVRTAYFKVYALDDNTEIVYSNLVTVSQDAYVAPTATIAVTPETVNVETSGEDEGSLAIAYENLTITDPADFDIQYYDANNEPLNKDDNPDWMEASIIANSTQDGYVVSFSVDPNDGEARTAYFKVFAMGDQDFVYSNLVTINQAAYVVDYATLPFEWEGGTTANFNALNGASTSGVGDYGDNQGVYRMKLDGTGDYIQVKTNEQPGVVTIGVKMIGGATASTLTVQGSADGETFTNVEALTISGSQNDILTLTTTNDFVATDRYVRLLFTKGSNVGVGPISIAQVDLTPSITVAPATLNLNCDGGDGELTVTTKNLADDPQLNVIFVEADGETPTQYAWITAEINAAGNVAGHIDANTGEARTAYLKVTGRDADNNLIKSNLVTFNQAAYTEPSIVFNTTTLDINAGGENRTLSFDYEGLGQNPTFSINFYESDGTTSATYDWCNAELVSGDNKVDVIVDANTGEARSAYFKVQGVNGAVSTESNLVTINQEAAGQTVQYALITSADDLTPGYHYLIVSGTNGDVKAMGEQKSNNRGEVGVTVANGVITNPQGVFEFVISGNGTEDLPATIYDENIPGYLYAAGTGSSNYLKTQDAINDRAQWTITIGSEYNAIITALTTATDRKIIRYNSNSSVFSCYGSGQQPIYLFKKVDDTPVYYSPTEVAVADPNPTSEPIIVVNNEILVLSGDLSNCTNPDNLIIQDGGQLVFEGDGVMATMLKSTAHAGAKDGVGDWYTIASPLKEDVTTSTSNTNLTTGMSTSEYDLYRYDEATAVWENSKDGANSSHFSEIELGRGYLYWREDGQDLFFAGELNNENVDYTLTADGTGNLKGFNLIGNPFSQNITMANIGGVSLTGGYVLTKAGGWGATVGEIAPCQGFLVQVENEANITISKNTVSKSRDNHDYIAFTMANSQYEDVTYAMFEEGLGLHKISHRNNNIPMVYIPQNGADYAIATIGNETEAFNLNVKAMTTGQYTLTMNAIGKYDYIHVIDRMTGEDIDMLIENEYTFVASPRDNENRFIVKLRYNASDNDVIGDSFAYQNGSDIIINGEGELQVFDITGRFVMSRTINGNESISTDAFNTGVYVFRMIGSEVKTQKIVVR